MIKRYNFDDIDFENKTYQEIATIVGCSVSKAFIEGKIRGKKRKDKISLNEINIEMTDQQIADKFNCSKRTVIYYRLKNGIKRSEVLRYKRILPDNLGLGIRPDTIIAKEMGVSRERVRQWRVSMGIPRPPKNEINLKGD